MKKIIVIAALQRSGTTALAQTLGQGSKIETFGEVFHAVRTAADGYDPAELMLRPEANFFAWKVARLRENPELSYPSVENQERLFREFMAYLSSLTEKPFILIDVKYNSWHHFDPVFHAQIQPPLLMQFLRMAGAHVVHIVRRDLVARHLSEQRALRTRRWHRRRGLPPAPADIETADLAPTEADLARARRMIALFEAYANHASRSLQLTYETMFAGDRLAPDTVQAISQLIGEDCDGGHVTPLEPGAAAPLLPNNLPVTRSENMKTLPVETIVREAWAAGQTIDLSNIGYGRIHWGDKSEVDDTPHPYYFFLAGLVKRFAFQRILEIGTHWGGATRAMWKGLHDPASSRVVTVDITTESDARLSAYPDIRKIVGDANEQKTVETVLSAFGDDPVDLIYLDALHYTMPTFLNFAIYATLLRPKMVVVDDITLNDDMRQAWSWISRSLPVGDAVNATRFEPKIRAKPGFGVALSRANC